jgi:hypothetical protein
MNDSFILPPWSIDRTRRMILTQKRKFLDKWTNKGASWTPCPYWSWFFIMHVFHMTWLYSFIYTDFWQESYDMNFLLLWLLFFLNPYGKNVLFLFKFFLSNPFVVCTFLSFVSSRGTHIYNDLHIWFVGLLIILTCLGENWTKNYLILTL